MLGARRSVGSPLYVLSAQVVRDNLRKLREAFSGARIHYAVKANPLIALLELLQDLGCGAECVGDYQLQLAERLSFRSESLILNGAAKSRRELERAVALGATINIADLDDLRQLASVTQRHESPARIRLRLRIADLMASAEHSTRGPINDFYRFKWGMPIDRLHRACRIASHTPHLDLIGLSFHLGQVTDPFAFGSAVYSAVAMAAALSASGLEGLTELDVGGGFRSYVDCTRYREAVDEGLDRAEAEFGVRPQQLILEPGRCLVESAGALVTRVTDVKHADDFATRFVLVDTSFTHLLLKTLKPARPRILASAQRNDLASTHISGATCSPDVLAISALLPTLEVDDYLVFLDAGAYADTLAASYNSIPRPPSAVVDGDGTAAPEASRRETLDDLLSRQPHR